MWQVITYHLLIPQFLMTRQVNLQSSLDPNCFFFAHLLKIYYILECYVVCLLVHIQGFQKHMFFGRGGVLKNCLLMEVGNNRSPVHCSRVQRKRWLIGHQLLQGLPLILSCSVPYTSSPSVRFYRSIPCYILYIYSHHVPHTSKPHVIFKISFNKHRHSSQCIQFYVTSKSALYSLHLSFFFSS